jgi:hypothetical protein
MREVAMRKDSTYQRLLRGKKLLFAGKVRAGLIPHVRREVLARPHPGNHSRSLILTLPELMSWCDAWWRLTSGESKSAFSQV